eukprot:NODE_1730_length_861_cov_232.658867_g1362_i0.p4 GENE.NODE_1730_length_861_cov_232.658867_g1362_i0~~NODE_1730_length_861_cov_232.658867_g1362_i0.p4  ORF type:complete len:55 (+),score=11.37 NODE_1730_length_861_cov_232.658867_g1362_i0:563-727(+)
MRPQFCNNGTKTCDDVSTSCGKRCTQDSECGGVSNNGCCTSCNNGICIMTHHMP